jgi:hypothetical protein
MALGVRYRCEWLDKEDVDLKVDLLQEGYSGAVTSISPAFNTFTIEWNGDRENVLKPVRGAIANFNVQATSAGQFDEFFSAYEKEWQLRFYYDGSLYWTGWVMVGEHIEEIAYPPYEVNFKAYDLGLLQDVYFDATREDDDSMIDVINHALAQTGISQNIKEVVNLYEDSITDGIGVTPLTQINVHQPAYLDDEWNGLTYYEVLERILMPFNAVLFQDNGVWNIVRVPDVAFEHNYRDIDTSGSVTGSGTEDTFVSSFSFLANTPVYMGVKSWKNLNFIYDPLPNNLIHNGYNENTDVTLSDFWTTSGTVVYTTAGGNYAGTHGRLMNIDGTVGTYATHTKTYSVEAADDVRYKLRFRIKMDWTGGVDTCSLTMRIKLTASPSDYYLNLTDGSWELATTNTRLSGFTRYQWREYELLTDKVPDDGTLSFQIIVTSGDFPISGASAEEIFVDYWEITAERYGVPYEDLTEEINSDNILNPEQIVIYHGDTNDGNTAGDVFLGSLQTTAGSVTDNWKSVNGSREDAIQQLCADVYKAQHVTTAKRLQAAIRHATLSPEDVISYDDKKFFFSTFTKDFTNCVADGEWIEIKTGWGDDLMNGETMVNGYLASDLFDTFSWSGNTATISHSPYSGAATASLTSGPDLTEGTRYRVTISFANVGSSDLPSFDIGGTVITQGELSGTEDNVFEIVSDADYTAHPEVMNHASGDACTALEVTITIEEAYGI